MSTLFISDLHLQPQQPKVIEAFLSFMDSRTHDAEALYILGDFFEAWIGDDFENAFSLRLIGALRTFSGSGRPLYFIHGNRDFLVGPRFAEQTGCKIVPDPSVIELYGRKVLLMHGDTLCTEDIDYLAFRNMVRNPQWQADFLAKPLPERLAIAQNLRETSKEKTGEKSNEIMDVAQPEVERVMAEHDLSLLIHGHTHRPATHDFTLNGLPATRIVLGDWRDKGWVLRVDGSGYDLQHFPI